MPTKQIFLIYKREKTKNLVKDIITILEPKHSYFKNIWKHKQEIENLMQM